MYSKMYVNCPFDVICLMNGDPQKFLLEVSPVVPKHFQLGLPWTSVPNVIPYLGYNPVIPNINQIDPFRNGSKLFGSRINFFKMKLYWDPSK